MGTHFHAAKAGPQICQGLTVVLCAYGCTKTSTLPMKSHPSLNSVRPNSNLMFTVTIHGATTTATTAAAALAFSYFYYASCYNKKNQTYYSTYNYIIDHFYIPTHRKLVCDTAHLISRSIRQIQAFL